MADDWDESEDVEYIDDPADSAGSGDDAATSADDSDNASDDSDGADASDDDSDDDNESDDDDESDSDEAEASDDDSDEDDDADASDDDSDDDSGAAASDDDDDDSDGHASGQTITRNDLDQGTDLPTGDNHDLVIPYEDVEVELEWPSYIADRIPDDFALTLSGDDMDDQTVTASGAEWTEEGAVRFAFSWRQKARAVTLKATSGDQSVTVWDKQVAGDLDTMIDWESKIDSLLTVDDANNDSDDADDDTSDEDDDDSDEDEDDDTTDADGSDSSDGGPSDGQSI